MDAGAKAAISGFRLQALYTLSLILDEVESSKVFQPEGKEDLAVYENGRLIRAIQVKAYSSPLRLSDLEPRKEGSFLRRLVNSDDESSVLQLVSFGPLGPELEAVQRREDEALVKLSEKLEEYGYSASEIDSITQRLEIERVNEAALRARVHQFFTQTMAAGEPERAFDLLVWWVLQAAESRCRITSQSLRDQLLAVGRYFAERAAYHDEWFTTIRPLDEQAAAVPPSAILAEEYYRGTAARYTHISAGLDVRRTEQLEAIESHFAENRKVVIIHGASGQGKTSLALRYLHDYVPSEWRFMVTAIDDRRHATKIANALADHLRVVNAPVWLFIDVTPRDLQWVALIRELLDIDNIRILVAIREEDLARRTASESEIGFPADILLEFTVHDAADIYTQLIEQSEAINAFPTFAEAWDRFGGEGPLLEFVYLVTQTQSLRSVLASQVRRLREEVRLGALEPAALHFLHVCAVVTSFEARINLAPLATRLELKDRSGTLALFEHEFLLRVSTDRTQVEALHPVRSDLLARELEDPAFARAAEVALQGLPYITEVDLEIFLLYLLSRMPDSWKLLREALSSTSLRTWTGAAGVSRALLWWGLKSYLETNRSTINDAIKIGGDAWTVTVLPDVAGALESDIGEEILQLIEKANPNAAAEIRRVRSRLTPRTEVFKPLSEWMAGLGALETPLDLGDWEGLAELTFWSSHLGISLSLSYDSANIPVAELPVKILAQLCLALANASAEKYSELMRKHGEQLRIRFREETGTLILKEDAESVTAEFLVPFDLLAGASKDSDLPDYASIPPAELAEEATPPGLDSKLNDEAVSRAELLRGLFPRKKKYCTQGHGHKIAHQGIELPHDSTLKTMPPTALPIPWLVHVNSTFHSLEAYRHRPTTWKDFAVRLLDVRETVASALLQLHRALVAYFEGNRPRNLFGGTLPTHLWTQAKAAAGAKAYLPTSAVDEWGLSSETQRSGSGKKAGFSANIASGFARNQPLSKAVRDYTFAISNFLNQAEMICILHGVIGRNLLTRDALLDIAKQHGYDEKNLRLSTHNLFQCMSALEALQQTYEKRVGHLVDKSHLARVTKREGSLFPELWALWYQFCYHPEQRMQSATTQSVSAMESSLSPVRVAPIESLASEAWRAVVISEKFMWMGRPALAMRLDLRSISDLEIARGGLIARLNEIFKYTTLGSLAGYALEYYWSHILVIPTLNGKALDPSAWVIPCFVFSSTSNQDSPDRSWLRPRHPLSSDQVSALGLEISSSSINTSLKELIEKFFEIQHLFAHLALFVTHIPDLDDTGNRILTRYLEEIGQQLNQKFDSIRELISPVVHQFRQAESVPIEVQDELLEPLDRLREDLEGSTGQIIYLEECEAKAAQFQQLAMSVGALQFLMLPGTLEMLASDPSTI